MKVCAPAKAMMLVLGIITWIVATSITGCTSGPLSSNLNGSPPYDKPTWSGDDHTPPVYTSPTVTPAATNFSNESPHS